MDFLLQSLVAIIAMGIGISIGIKWKVPYSEIEKMAQICELESVSSVGFTCKNGLTGEWSDD